MREPQRGKLDTESSAPSLGPGGAPGRSDLACGPWVPEGEGVE